MKQTSKVRMPGCLRETDYLLVKELCRSTNTFAWIVKPTLTLCVRSRMLMLRLPARSATAIIPRASSRSSSPIRMGAR